MHSFDGMSSISQVFLKSNTEYSTLVYQITEYTYNYDQIAKQLASIGVLMKLTYALPFIDFLALLAGAVIITLAIAIVYAAIAVTVNELILSWYAYSSVNLTAAHQNTAAIVAQYNNGFRFWRAFLTDYNGLGGIWIADPIPYIFAQNIVLEENMYVNVFAMHYSDAAHLASYAYGNGFTGPEAHRGNGKIFNMQHLHARTITGRPGYCHIFFAVPSIA